MKYASIIDLREEYRPHKEVRRSARIAKKEGLTFEPVPFGEFKDFYASLVEVKKSEEKWKELGAEHFAYMVKKDGRPIAGLAFKTSGKDVYYSMSATDYSLPESAHAGYFAHHEMARILKEGGYRLYVIGSQDVYADKEKSKRLWEFKRKLGDLYQVDGSEFFPFTTYTKVTTPPKE